MNEYDLQEKKWEGARAKEVLDNETFQWAFESIEQELTDKWKSSPARDEAGREKLFLMLQMLLKVKEVLTSRVETGKLSELELEHKKTIASRVQGLWRQ